MANKNKTNGGKIIVEKKELVLTKENLIQCEPNIIDPNVKLSDIKDKFSLEIKKITGGDTIKKVLTPYLVKDRLCFIVPAMSKKEMNRIPDNLLMKVLLKEGRRTELIEEIIIPTNRSRDLNEIGEELIVKIDSNSREFEKMNDSLRQDISSKVDQLSDAILEDKGVSVLPPAQNFKSELIPLFRNIQASQSRISFEKYYDFVERIFFGNLPGNDKNLFNNKRPGFVETKTKNALPFNNIEGYKILKSATEAFFSANVGIDLDSSFFNDETAIQEAADRAGIHFSGNDTKKFIALWKNHIQQNEDYEDINGNKVALSTLPYLYTIRNFFKRENIKDNWFDEFQKTADWDKMAQACYGVIRERLTSPLFIELIWSYWQEEGMLVQSMNAISRRFQNMRSNKRNDPLAEMEISHLRPLNNILWGYIQDEQHRLSVVRRAYEYDHHYGITLSGKAIPKIESADSRARFLEAFHNVLYITAKYYTETANRLVDPDAFPILNALRNVHFIISEGMHNQYGDLPTTARMEMMMQQFILARPEFDRFLSGRAAIPYPEAWMTRVSSMNKLQGWTDVSPIHFNFLAEYGEQLLLSIRFGDWINRNRADAAQWALFFRQTIQGYIHSYKTATGVDLTANIVGNKVDARPPSYHLAKRALSSRNGKVPKPTQNGVNMKKSKQKKEWL